MRLDWWADTRRRLEQLFPRIYGAPSGWRRYPTLSVACDEWATALSYTSKEAKLLLRRLLTEHWDALRHYWNLTCQRTTEAADDAHTRDCVSKNMKARREDHARKPAARVNQIIERRQLRLTELSNYWTSRRNAALSEVAQPDGTQETQVMCRIPRHC
jgi:hypothetical protein